MCEGLRPKSPRRERDTQAMMTLLARRLANVEEKSETKDAARKRGENAD